jgi:hypothetical protein
MSNMSYVRFQNTLRDLRDCGDALDEIQGNLAELSKEEAQAANQLIQMCADIANSFDTSKQ